MVLENIGLVYTLAKRYCVKPQDFQDLVQAGLIGLFEGARRFDPEHSSGAAFGTFVYDYIKGAVLAYYYSKTEDIPDQLTEELEQTLLTDSEAEFIRTELRADLLRHIRELEENERLVILLRWLPAKPMTLQALAKDLGLTHTRVMQIEGKAFAKLRKMMGG